MNIHMKVNHATYTPSTVETRVRHCHLLAWTVMTLLENYTHYILFSAYVRYSYSNGKFKHKVAYISYDVLSYVKQIDLSKDCIYIMGTGLL
jgi:hypothetical protein